MVQKIVLTLEIDDSALDAAQAKADKLVATLKEAEALAEILAKEKPPEGGNSCKCEDMTERLDIAREIAQAMFKAPD